MLELILLVLSLMMQLGPFKTPIESLNSEPNTSKLETIIASVYLDTNDIIRSKHHKKIEKLY